MKRRRTTSEMEKNIKMKKAPRSKYQPEATASVQEPEKKHECKMNEQESDIQQERRETIDSATTDRQERSNNESDNEGNNEDDNEDDHGDDNKDNNFQIDVTEDKYSNSQVRNNQTEYEQQGGATVVDDINESICSRLTCSCHDRSLGYGSFLQDSTLESNSNRSILSWSLERSIEYVCRHYRMPRTSSPRSSNSSSSSLTRNFAQESSLCSPILDNNQDEENQDEGNQDVENQDEKNQNEQDLDEENQNKEIYSQEYN